MPTLEKTTYYKRKVSPTTPTVPYPRPGREPAQSQFWTNQQLLERDLAGIKHPSDSGKEAHYEKIGAQPTEKMIFPHLYDQYNGDEKALGSRRAIASSTNLKDFTDQIKNYVTDEKAQAYLIALYTELVDDKLVTIELDADKNVIIPTLFEKKIEQRAFEDLVQATVTAAASTLNAEALGQKDKFPRLKKLIQSVLGWF